MYICIEITQMIIHSQTHAWYGQTCWLIVFVVYQAGYIIVTINITYPGCWCPYSHWKVASNKIWWLCLVPTSTTRFASDVGYRMANKIIGLYKEIIFKNNDIKFLNIEWSTPYPLTNFEDRFGLRDSVTFLDSTCVLSCSFVHWLAPKL